MGRRHISRRNFDAALERCGRLPRHTKYSPQNSAAQSVQIRRPPSACKDDHPKRGGDA
ncbi:MAG: hypothetical protein KF716_20125 [Anaerolineae bacterium]|nr:hypothetical protein [Anaerolineae bacterium]